MRHNPFSIGPAERGAWFAAMSFAVGAGDLGDGDQAAFLASFDTAATAMNNWPG